VGPHGGAAEVWRTTGPPEVGSDAPATRWQEIPVAGGTGIVLGAPAGSGGTGGCQAAYWDPASGIFTSVISVGDAPFCERFLRAIVE
jgi:hypothetical protein